MKMNEKRLENINVFNDTIDIIHSNRELFSACEYSKRHTKLISTKDSINFPKVNREGEIVVVNDRSFHSCMNERGKIGVLNFASATTPGGGVVRGSNAQEECLCRCSTLYPCLNQEEFHNSFYFYHRALKSVFYSDLMLYTKDVYVFKSDTAHPELLDADKWKKVDVITSAAPNLRNEDEIDKKELELILYNRIQRILEVSIQNRVSVLVLGAFGCGAFKNPPEIVSNVFYQLLVGDDYRYYFEKIIFAVYGQGKDMHNYDVFQEQFKEV